MNILYVDGNLKVLLEHIKDESVDLIYLVPLFNSYYSPGRDHPDHRNHK